MARSGRQNRSEYDDLDLFLPEEEEEYRRDVRSPAGTNAPGSRGSAARGTGRPGRGSERPGRDTGRQGSGRTRPYEEMPSRRGSSRGTSRRKKRFPWQLLVALAIILLIGAVAGSMLIEHYSYSNEKEDLYSWFSVSDDSDAAVYWGEERESRGVRLIGGTYYIEFGEVISRLNSRFYYGEKDNVVIYCLPTDRVVTVIGENRITASAGVEETGYAPALMEDGTLYLALDFVRRFTSFDYECYEAPNRIRIRTDAESAVTAEVTKDTNLRTSGGIKSPILVPLGSGDRVTVLEEMQTWSRVRTEDLVTGYVENKFLGERETAEVQAPANYTEPEYPDARISGLVNMGWHNVAGAGGNDTIYSYMAEVKSMNVISPTWFPLASDDGTLECYATHAYMDAARNMGLRVWPAVDNFNIPGVDHNNALTTMASREKMISQLMQWAAEYGFEGINVDFEQVSPDCGDDFIEFVRELSIACHRMGLTLSVDNYVTYDFNDYYRMDEQALFADYTVIMGYDEHYAGSVEAGSVASFDYVQYGIKRALEEVPSSKLINGIPFYTRLWKKSSDGGLTSEALDMMTANAFVANHALTPEWDGFTCQNYVRLEEGGTLYQMWLEDAESIEAKLSLMRSYELAGVAEWKLSQETPDVWDVIERYMNGGELVIK